MRGQSSCHGNARLPHLGEPAYLLQNDDVDKSNMEQKENNVFRDSLGYLILLGSSLL